MTNAWPDGFPTSISRVVTDDIAMWEKLHPSAAQVFSRTPTLQVTWLTPNQRRCVLCILGSHTFVPISWNCKKQTAVSHSSTEAYLLGRWSKIGLNSFAQVAGHGS